MRGTYKILVDLFGAVLDKSGLKDSILSQCQRCACVLNDDYVAMPKPGTPLIVDLFGVVEHSGIYLGGGHVAELFGDNLLREVTLKEFVEGESGSWVRTGSRVFAACDQATGLSLHARHAVSNARAYIRRRRTVRYDLFRNNCHLFSISCISGNFQSGISFGDVLQRGGVSIGVLTAAVQYFLNDGKVAVWKPVKGWDRKSLGAKAIDDPKKNRCEERLENAVKKIKSEKQSYKLDKAGFEKSCVAVQKESGIFGPFIELLKVAYETVADAISGKRSDIPWDVIAWIAAAIAYLIMPVDLIPDAIPVFGYADDATVFLTALQRLMPYIRLTSSVCAKIMKVDPHIEKWIRSIGEPGGVLSADVSNKEANKEFFISAALIEYYKKRFCLQVPVEAETIAKTSIGKWTDWEGCDRHQWKLQASALGCRMLDPLGSSYVWGTKRNVRKMYEQFMTWYENILLPKIILEEVD